MEEVEPVCHLLVLAEKKFLVSNDFPKTNKTALAQEILDLVKQKEMGPYYENVLTQQLPTYFKLDQTLLQSLKEANQNKLKELEDKISDANQNLGENEVREALLAKAQYYYSIGDKENALSAFRETETKTVALGQKLDILFALLRIGFAFDDKDIVKRNLERANSLIVEGGDWERRNRLKVYEGIHLMTIRNFSKAAKLFLDSISTFSSSEIMTFEQFIFYTIVVTTFSLGRPEMKKNILESSDVLSVIHKLPNAEQFVRSFYNCQYNLFLVSLVELMDNQLIKDRYLSKHVRFYSREMRVRAYSQFLQAYKSVTLDAMAEQFGLSPDFLDMELSRFISADKLNAKIDKVSGVIESSRTDEKNTLYNHTLKQGDHLLNRIQKLSKVIDL
ncbi:26S proteasome regulatory subunit RPN7 [Naegleria gruberi]|uniref:26S proteasome regulatory subunit RPN7 n=1 Tax=Naegleria gruberi TaxID=5762 RepID=D2VRR1_NAEGR|nr:26S proteasome regulatory subunit RPN7 [Naegleria gruberi]EFC40505.1 26S proteasome regulatory subunit RPN7 [Naegleria gruberi]|eukprot:XP_002673249.1 26S proteasome regulatory subunit RPN7 [Naegleria gruberi strain NEG-M]